MYSQCKRESRDTVSGINKQVTFLLTDKYMAFTDVTLKSKFTSQQSLLSFVQRTVKLKCRLFGFVNILMFFYLSQNKHPVNIPKQTCF